MRVRALAVRILKQFFHDKRTLAMMIAAPLLILWMMSLVFNSGSTVAKIGAVQVPSALTDILSTQGLEVNNYSVEEAAQALEKNNIDAIISMNGPQPQVKLEGSDPGKNKAIIMLLQKTMQQLNPINVGAAPQISYLHGSEAMTSFDNIGPVLVGFFSFFFVFLIAGVSFLKERTSGTLERLLATPLKRWEIVVGYVLGFGIFTMLQATLIAWFATQVLGMMIIGSFGYVLLITLLMSLTALTLGIFLSAFANTEFQMIQFIPLVVVPQIFFSGLFSLDNMALWMQWLSKIMPLTYGADALRKIMIRGEGWPDIAVDAYLLIGLSIFFMLANVLALRKHRKI
ncbi:MAG: ABC-type multidrug transport system, permease component [Bacilli bacterium]|nr:ABC-type multidrug transport system, permease component [Bacilli bacterium]